MLTWTEKWKLLRLRNKIIRLERKKELVKEYAKQNDAKLTLYRKQAKALMMLDIDRETAKIPPR